MKHPIIDKLETLFLAVYARADENGAVLYFSAADFEGLRQTPFTFTSSKGHKIKGYFYDYEGYTPDRIVIFEHGMGSGHRGYMKEIERIARAGYRVLSYDHTGCMESGGETTGGFAQSAADLADLLAALDADPRFATQPISVVGHSWGGFSALNAPALSSRVTHVVALSGFLSVPRMAKQLFSGIFHPVCRRIVKRAVSEHPRFATIDACESLKGTNARVLVIHSKDDPTVKYKASAAVLQEKLAEMGNIRFLTVNGKRHNPNYTADAVRYKDRFFKIFKKALKRGELSTPAQREAFRGRFDWQRMTEQDEAVWSEILQHLEK